MVTQPDGGVSQSAIDDFHVALEVFEGPFDLLLQLITRKKLDITEVSLSEVTDEFIAHMRLFPDLSQTTEFLVVAATLLDIKAARLLPAPESDAEASTQDLKTHNLLFSRLLQYRTFKTVSTEFSRRLDATSGLLSLLAEKLNTRLKQRGFITSRGSHRAFRYLIVIIPRHLYDPLSSSTAHCPSGS